MEDNEHLPGQEQGATPPPPDPVIPNEPIPSSTNQPKEMEVHQHGHVHEKSKWKEYAFQFLMLFLAVILGFAAEKFREHQIEKNMEHEYIVSLVADVESDRTLISELIDSIYSQAKKIDTLQTLFSTVGTATDKESIITQCYALSGNIAKYYPVNFNQTTITSLLSSGNLRLIKSTESTNGILVYYNTIKNTDEQRRLYHDYINKCLETMYNVYDIALLRSTIANDSLLPPKAAGTRFVTMDPLELNKLNANMERAKTSAFLLINRIGAISGVGKELLALLRQEYHLKE